MAAKSTVKRVGQSRSQELPPLHAAFFYADLGAHGHERRGYALMVDNNPLSGRVDTRKEAVARAIEEIRKAGMDPKSMPGARSYDTFGYATADEAWETAHLLRQLLQKLVPFAGRHIGARPVMVSTELSVAAKQWAAKQKPKRW